MTTRPLTAGIAWVITVIACVVVASYWNRGQRVSQDASKVVAAVHAFVRDKSTGGHAMPSSVSLRDLINEGYITTSDVRAFDGMEIAISLTIDETRPQEILCRARLPDGTVIANLVDGSVLQLPR